jgi:hypothetical protein
LLCVLWQCIMSQVRYLGYNYKEKVRIPRFKESKHPAALPGLSRDTNTSKQLSLHEMVHCSRYSTQQVRGNISQPTSTSLSGAPSPTQQGHTAQTEAIYLHGRCLPITGPQEKYQQHACFYLTIISLSSTLPPPHQPRSVRCCN